MYLKEYLKEETDKINQLIIKKNEDYGDSFNKSIEKYGDVAFIVRLSDKFNRLDNLLNSELQSVDKQVNYESVEDTLDDIIGYALLYKYYRSKKEKEEMMKILDNK